jgi:hypothetical protein
MYKQSPITRFWRKVEKTSTCWNWTGYKWWTGYGMFIVYSEAGHANEIRETAHVFSYQLVHGPVPDGLEVDHLCRNRGCVNPDHLEAVTHKENMLRSLSAPPAINARKTQCPNGHAYSGTNLFVNAKGHRHCRSCHAEQERNRRKVRSSVLSGLTREKMSISNRKYH